MKYISYKNELKSILDAKDSEKYAFNPQRPTRGDVKLEFNFYMGKSRSVYNNTTVRTHKNEKCQLQSHVQMIASLLILSSIMVTICKIQVPSTYI